MSLLTNSSELQVLHLLLTVSLDSYTEHTILKTHTKKDFENTHFRKCFTAGRKVLGLVQAQVEDALGVSIDTINQRESEKEANSRKNVQKN